MLHLYTKIIEGTPTIGYLFTNDKNPSMAAFFYDSNKGLPCHTQAPGPSFRVIFEDRMFYAITFLVGKYERGGELSYKEFNFLKDCAILVELLEYPTYNMSGKESQCHYDQNPVSDIKLPTIQS